MDLSTCIVSQWEDIKLKVLLARTFAQNGHVIRINVALDEGEAFPKVRPSAKPRKQYR